MAEEYQYSKYRKNFGKPAQFEDFDGIKMVGTVAPEPSKQENFVLRNPNKLILDNIPLLSHHSVSRIYQISYKSVTSAGQHRESCHAEPRHEAHCGWLAP